MATDDTARTNLYFPRPILDALDRSAEANRRTRSAEAVTAVEAYLALRASVTGASRLRDLERIAAQHLTGAPMPDDTDPRPPDVGGDDNAPAPAFGGPFGKGTVDEKVIAQNAGRQTQISRDCSNANKQHLADHLARTGGKLPGNK